MLRYTLGSIIPQHNISLYMHQFNQSFLRSKLLSWIVNDLRKKDDTCRNATGRGLVTNIGIFALARLLMDKTIPMHWKSTHDQLLLGYFKPVFSNNEFIFSTPSQISFVSFLQISVACLTIVYFSIIAHLRSRSCFTFLLRVVPHATTIWDTSYCW